MKIKRLILVLFLCGISSLLYAQKFRYMVLTENGYDAMTKSIKVIAKKENNEKSEVHLSLIAQYDGSISTESEKYQYYALVEIHTVFKSYKFQIGCPLLIKTSNDEVFQFYNCKYSNFDDWISLYKSNDEGYDSIDRISTTSGYLPKTIYRSIYKIDYNSLHKFLEDGVTKVRFGTDGTPLDLYFEPTSKIEGDRVVEVNPISDAIRKALDLFEYILEPTKGL